LLHSRAAVCTPSSAEGAQHTRPAPAFPRRRSCGTAQRDPRRASPCSCHPRSAQRARWPEARTPTRRSAPAVPAASRSARPAPGSARLPAADTERETAVELHRGRRRGSGLTRSRGTTRLLIPDPHGVRRDGPRSAGDRRRRAVPGRAIPRGARLRRRACPGAPPPVRRRVGLRACCCLVPCERVPRRGHGHASRFDRVADDRLWSSRWPSRAHR
jgi:hypothetical protein